MLIAIFMAETGANIDVGLLQRRRFKQVLKALKLQDRDIYTCRNNFATRVVQAGMKAHEVAYLMGDKLQTVIANYYHNEKVTLALPNLVTHKTVLLKHRMKKINIVTVGNKLVAIKRVLLYISRLGKYMDFCALPNFFVHHQNRT